MTAKNTKEIKQLIIEENQQLFKENLIAKEKILELESRLSEALHQAEQIDAAQTQQIDDLENSFALYHGNIEDLQQKVDKKLKKSNPVIPLIVIGISVAGILAALGLNLNVKFGESSISYKGEGVTSGLVEIAIATVSGGLGVGALQNKVLSSKVKALFSHE